MCPELDIRRRNRPRKRTNVSGGLVKPGGVMTLIDAWNLTDLAQQAQHTKTPVVDLELRSARETTYTVG